VPGGAISGDIEIDIRLLEYPVEIDLVVPIEVGGQFDDGAGRHSNYLGGSAG
jgi:hypothetical protein